MWNHPSSPSNYDYCNYRAAQHFGVAKLKCHCSVTNAPEILRLQLSSHCAAASLGRKPTEVPREIGILLCMRHEWSWRRVCHSRLVPKVGLTMNGGRG